MTSLWVMYPKHPGWQCREGKQCMRIEISGDQLWVDAHTADDISLLRSLADRFAPNGQSFVAAPFWPGAYALLERKSPLWEIYPILPRTESFEKKEIKRIEAVQPGFAILLDNPLDGRDELRFSKTHPFIYQYINNHFDLLPDSCHQVYKIYRSRQRVKEDG